MKTNTKRLPVSLWRILFRTKKVVFVKVTYQFAIWQVEIKDRPRVLRK